jgi:hypothetical protein
MEMPSRPSWWSRNWIWFIPVTVIGLFVMCAGCFGGIFYFAITAIKASTPYKDALAYVSADAEVAAALGTPIKADWWAFGSVSEGSSGGRAELIFGVSGPNGSGVVEALSEKQGGAWVFKHMSVQPTTGGQTIELVAPPDETGGSPDGDDESDDGS